MTVLYIERLIDVLCGEETTAIIAMHNAKMVLYREVIF